MLNYNFGVQVSKQGIRLANFEGVVKKTLKNLTFNFKFHIKMFFRFPACVLAHK